VERRQVLRTAALGSLVAAAVPATVALAGTAANAGLAGRGGGRTATGTGAGMYVDMSTLNQMSTFTIQPTLVSCGVGTFGIGLTGTSGPFSMLMYSVSIPTYNVDRAAGTIYAAGRMRSITMLAAGLMTESVEHDFIAIAVDNHGVSPDRFDVHFTTPMWGPGGLGNLMATPSTVRPGWQRFGGNVASALGALGGVKLGGVSAG
jgi:hypothetical protein